MALFKNKYRIESSRLKNWDYRNGGFYFITICVKDRLCHFGECVGGQMNLNNTGNIVHQFWKEIPDHFSNVGLGEFVVMPNHLHGILVLDDSLFNTSDEIDCFVAEETLPVETMPIETLQCNVSTIKSNDEIDINKNQFMSNISPKPGSASTIIRSFKSICTKTINRQFPELHFKWQDRFHDRIIRDHDEYLIKENYILNNPQNWKVDKFFYWFIGFMIQ